MAKLFKKADDAVVKETTEKVSQVFEKNGVSLPAELNPKKAKPSKTDMKLMHVALEHLYVGVLQNLRVSKAELKELDDDRAKELRDNIKKLIAVTSDIINELDVDALLSVDEIDEQLEKLADEVKLAQALALTNNVPKEKMH